MDMINMLKKVEHEKAFANLSGDARVLYHKILNLSRDLEKANIKDISDIQKMAKFQLGPTIMYSILVDALEHAHK